MKKIKERVWSNYMKVKGGDFLNWYEGLTPIELYYFKNQMRLN